MIGVRAHLLATTLVALTLAGAANSQSEPSHATSPKIEVVVQHDVPMKTRDGVTLFADIYRPDTPGKFPVILMRTPYDKNVGWTVSLRPIRWSPSLRRSYSRRSRPVYVRRRVVSIPARAGRWLRHCRMGCRAAVFQWQGRHDRGFVRGATQMLAAIAQPPILQQSLRI